MRREDLHKLLGGYAAGTLTEAERVALFEAALHDQALFDALADEEALRDTLADPQCRARLLAELREERRARWWLVLLRRPLPWALAGGLAAACIVAFVLVRRAEIPATQLARFTPPRQLVAPAVQPPVAAPRQLMAPAVQPPVAARLRAPSAPVQMGGGGRGAASVSPQAPAAVARRLESPRVVSAPVPPERAADAKPAQPPQAVTAPVGEALSRTRKEAELRSEEVAAAGPVIEKDQPREALHAKRAGEPLPAGTEQRQLARILPPPAAPAPIVTQQPAAPAPVAAQPPPPPAAAVASLRVQDKRVQLAAASPETSGVATRAAAQAESSVTAGAGSRADASMVTALPVAPDARQLYYADVSGPSSTRVGGVGAPRPQPAVERLAAPALKAQAQRPLPVALALRYALLKPAKGGSQVEVAPTTPLEPGERVRLRVQVNQRGHLYVLAGDAALFAGPVEPRHPYDMDLRPGVVHLILCRQPDAGAPATLVARTQARWAGAGARADDRLASLSRDPAAYVANPSTAPDACVLAEIPLNFRTR